MLASTKKIGDEGEARALAHLLGLGLKLVERNYRVAAGPRARGAELDLILRDRDNTLVFVEVRRRRGHSHGGAAGSVTRTKQRALAYAARRYLMKWASPPPCRFDVVCLEGDHIDWLQAAFTLD